MTRTRTPDPPPVEVAASAVGTYDSLAIFNARSRTHKYERVRRVYHDRANGLVEITTAGGTMKLPAATRIKVAGRAHAR